MPIVEVIRDCPNVGKKGTRANLTDVEANTLIALEYVRLVVMPVAEAPVEDTVRPAAAAKKKSKKKARRRNYKRRDIGPEANTDRGDDPIIDDLDSTG